MSLNPCSFIFTILKRSDQNLHARNEMNNEYEYKYEIKEALETLPYFKELTYLFHQSIPVFKNLKQPEKPRKLKNSK